MSDPTEPRRQFRVTLESLPEQLDGRPVELRLKAALKRLLRSFRFKAVQVEEVSADKPTPTEEARS